MRRLLLNSLGIATLAAALGGCAAGSSYVQSAPGHPGADVALADEVYLDGTGPSARRLGHARQPAETLYSAVPQSGGPTRPVVRSRPLAIERADALSSSTTGARASAPAEADKPFSDSWWAKERAEDARLKAKMNICRGC